MVKERVRDSYKFGVVAKLGVATKPTEVKGRLVGMLLMLEEVMIRVVKRLIFMMFLLVMITSVVLLYDHMRLLIL